MIVSKPCSYFNEETVLRWWEGGFLRTGDLARLSASLVEDKFETNAVSVQGEKTALIIGDTQGNSFVDRLILS